MGVIFKGVGDFYGELGGFDDAGAGDEHKAAAPDGVRSDTGEAVDTAGGWHDAGDLRKWMEVTMLNGIALLNLFRNIPEPRLGDPTHGQILEEVRFAHEAVLLVMTLVHLVLEPRQAVLQVLHQLRHQRRAAAAQL